MPDVTINSLTTKTALNTTNYLPISDGSTTTKLGTDSLFGFRNYIINGDFRLDQRNAGSSVIVNTGGPSTWTGPDRFFAYQNSPSTNVSVQRQTINVPTGFQYALRWGRSGSGTPGGITVLATALETDQSIPLAGKTVTLSFYAAKGANYSQQNSQLGAMLISGTGTDQSRGEMITFAWTGVTRPIETSVSLSTSWQRFTLTGTVPNNSRQLGLYFSWVTSGVAGADDNVYITGIQLEEGSTSTNFERRPFTIEQQLCQRFYEISDGNMVTIVWPNGPPITITAQIGNPIFFKVSKRIIPFVAESDVSLAQGGGWINLPIDTVGINYYISRIQNPPGTNAYVVKATKWTADAEL